MRGIKYFLILLIIFPLVNASVISINSGGSNTTLLNPSKEVEGFFFSGNLTNITITPGGGGGGGTPAYNLNETICWESYTHLLHWGDNYSLVNLLQSNIRMTYQTNFSVSELWTNYISTFQGGCSELIKRTLEPKFVCNTIGDFKKTKNNLTESDIQNLKDVIDDKITITPNLIQYYFDNYDDVCKEYISVKPIEFPKEFIRISLWLFIFIILITIIIIILLLERSLRSKKKYLDKTKYFNPEDYNYTRKYFNPEDYPMYKKRVNK